MPIGPKQDPYRVAARHCLDGDCEAAYRIIKETWIESIIADFEPDVDADEDGEYSNPRGELQRAASQELDGYLDQAIGDAAYELLVNGTSEEDALARAQEVADKVRVEFQKHVDAVADDAYELWSDGAAQSRDPYAYHGVNRSDF